jgi:putative PIG3 family NAD(P)H quinone oxidoreductase
MRALRIVDQGGPEVLSLQDVPEPSPGPAEISVRVKAAALNRADLLQCMGLYPAPPDAPPDIPGLEYAGEVKAVGPRVRRFKPGDRVMGIVGGGAFAEVVVVHEREALPIPSGLSWSQAAAIPEAFMTAWDAVLVQGGLRGGESLLIHAVASGVGTAGCQLATVLGATVVGTSRSADKLERCRRELRLQHGIACPERPVFADAVRKATGGHGADVVLDLAGGEYLPETLDACAYRARLVLVGLLAGPQAELPLGKLMQKRIRLHGTVLRSRPLEEKIAAATGFEREVLPLFDRGSLYPVLDAVLPFPDARAAFERMQSNASFGKIVLQWEPG